MSPFESLVQTLWHMVLDSLQILADLVALGMQWSLLIAWFAWWLLAVNWKKTWPALAQGAWAPVVLLIIVAALAWSRIAPSEYNIGIAYVANFWWQLGAVGLVAAATLFCGWLQGVFQWTPTEISLAPPAHADGHAHH
ncbi:MAG: hypothetical protein L0Y72_01970 [Gemmataceae bacterium]|nr:hypothetical protein [Gemmataceae bacterium]MCI0737783.1 hypothetical protein [Gemmataceae bacterium]